MRNFIIIILIFGSLASSGQNQKYESKLYHDGHGGFVYFPLGAISFADEVISFTEGNPTAKDIKIREPKIILGEPDYNMETFDNSLTLGCGGTITFHFIDNALVDQIGPDLYVFEIGSGIEPTTLSISKDGISWIDIGEISGGRADIDISPFVNISDIFYYVKLTDLKSSCNNDWPGSDIDAVGAIGSAIQITLSNSVLFEFGKFDLKKEASNEIKNLITQISGIDNYTIEIEGHTDSIGSDAANNLLSLNRANAVKKQFLIEEKIDSSKITVKGYGESVPIVNNSTEENRQKNRRVNIIIIPKSVQRKTYEVETNSIFMPYYKKEGVFKNVYPQAFNEKTFPRVWTTDIDEALTLNNIIYFFKGGMCQAFNKKSNKVEGEPKKINDFFPGLWESGIEAVINWGNGKLYFFKGSEYIRFDTNTNKADTGYPKTMAGNWGSSWFDNGVDCAINWGNGYAYFFKNGEYMKYNVSEDKPLNGYPLTNAAWESLWLNKVDGVFDFAPNEVYFFKNPKKEK
ncbi:MAG: hypothetical protein A2033_07385 [Bacteroidetes bacterium GWA2_31_9]|nr:MAG: hypothetical protein A2033_07385 [Bacteroidetes bacterium GWA2_31_9]